MGIRDRDGGAELLARLGDERVEPLCRGLVEPFLLAVERELLVVLDAGELRGHGVDDGGKRRGAGNFEEREPVGLRRGDELRGYLAKGEAGAKADALDASVGQRLCVQEELRGGGLEG